MYTDDDLLDAIFFEYNEPVWEKPYPKTSYEQQSAIHFMLDGDNVIVDSVSGSGKSTTILAAAEQMPDSRILQLTFNAALRKEIQEKVKTRGIRNIDVHTFHSLAVMYYHKDAHKDIIMRKILYDRIPPRKPIPKYDMVFLDEAQDMTMLYYMFIVKFLLDAGQPIQICILGDYKQGIYQFKGADIRFLTKAHIIWSAFPLLKTCIFRECCLSMSYRLTHPMANFVNRAMLGETRLLACRAGPKVKYIRNSRANLEKMVIFYVRSLLDAGASPSDIFVLAASVKKKSIRKMENVLVERNIPCYVPMFETETMDEKVMEGKLVFSTFHSVKGRERKHVFVMGFDHSYFPHYASDLPVDECPNTLYVAATRATDNLYLLEIDQFQTDRPLDFLRLNHFEMRDADYIDFRGTPQKYFDVSLDEFARGGSGKKEEYHDVSPTSLIRFVSDSVIETISPILDRIFVVESDADPESEIDLPVVVSTGNQYHEDVSDLNGIAIPSIYYDHIYKSTLINSTDTTPDITSMNIGSNILLEIIHTGIAESKDHEYGYLKKVIAELPSTISTPAEYLYLANVFVAVKEKLYFKLKQIGSYDWLSDSVVKQCLDRIESTVGSECFTGESPPTRVLPSVEEAIIDHSMDIEQNKIRELLTPHFPADSPKKFRFSARTDLITPQTIWELKCTSTLSMEHQLQLVVYSWIWQIIHPESPRSARLFNIRTGERLLLSGSFDDIHSIVVELLKGKYETPIPKTDEEFERECREYMGSAIERNINR